VAPWRDEDELLRKDVLHLQVLRRERLRDECRLDLAPQDPVDERAARAGDELEPHPGMRAVIGGEHGRQARGGGAFERAEPEQPVQRMALDRGLRLGRQAQQPLGVAEQQPAFRREHERALAVKSFAPRRSSSCLTRVVTFDCTRCSAVAARVMPPCSATVLKI
jgi:hypothetical protein